MPAFKQKSSKKLLTDTKNSVTLDHMHREKQAEFHYIQTELVPKLEQELAENKTFLKEHGTTPRSKTRTETMLDEVYRIRDRNIEIKESLQNYKNYIKNYYLTNNKYVFSYFEDKKDISDTVKDDAVEPEATGPAPTFTKNQRIQSFFKVNAHAPEPTPASARDLVLTQNQITKTTTPTDSESSLSSSLSSASLFNPPNNAYAPKLTNLQHYLHNTGRAFFDYDKYAYRADVCAWCNSGEMVAIESEGILVCNKCSNFTVYYVETDKPSYKEPPKEASFYAYRRINHFREILAQVQAKETTQIDNSIITAIENQIRKERINLDQFTDTKAKEVLKKLGYNKYYEHIPFIKEKLGIKPPVMSPELEETLCNLFMETQGPYARFCPDERVNFLNYYYTIYKLCELLGQTQYLPYFPMLKDRDKRIEQDEIWKKICKELNWEFIPTQ